MVPRGTFIGYKNTSAIRTPLRNVNGYKNTLSAERTVNKNVLAVLMKLKKKETTVDSGYKDTFYKNTRGAGWPNG